MQQTIVAVFDTRATAQQAMSALLNEGFSQDSIQLSEGGATTAGTSATTDTSASGESTGSGILHFFKDLFGSDDHEDARVYSNAVSRGNCVLTINASSDAQVYRATAILDSYNPLDIDEHASEWGGGTWAQTDTGRSSMGTQAASQQFAQTQSSSGSTGSAMGAQQYAQSGTQELKTGETRAIPVIQEEVRVGKREVQRGGVRIYQRVSETPVNQTVDLREEHVTIERRPVDQQIDPSQATFQEGTLELRETAEEAVVQKTARVVEEVVVGKQVEQRQQQINDTVRRTDVEVNQLQGDQTGLSDVDDSYYRTHWQSNFASAGGSYDDYAPAYRFGSQMAANEHYRGRSWDEVEPNLRSSWEMNNSGSTWDKMKAAVRHGWNRVTS